MPPQQVVLFIIGTIVIVFGAWYVTHFIGMKATGQTRAGMRNRNIKVLDRFAIARDKQFCIVEIAGKVYVVGMTNNSMTLLDTVDAEEFAVLTEADEEVTAWNMTPVAQYGNKLTRKLVAFIAEKTGRTGQSGKDASESDFSEHFEEAKRSADNQPDDTEDD